MKLLELFSGIGGFSLGFHNAGYKFDWVGFSDIDKYANEVFKRRFPNAEQLGDITNVQCEDLPEDITILSGGFPCQAFSIAGKREGFSDTRGTLFFEIVRILQYFRELGKPIPYFLLENVKGLLNHDDGRTFATIYRVLTELGYTVECQIINTRWFLPQNRERIFFVGYIGDGSGSKVFPIRENGRENPRGREDDGARISAAPSREYGWKDISPTLCSRDYKDPKLVKVADFRNDEGLRVRGDGNSPCLSTRRHSKTDISTMPPLLIKTHNLQQRNPDRPSKLNGQSGGSGHLSKEDGTAYCLEGNNLQAVETKMAQEDLMIRDGRDNRSCLRAGRTPELGIEGSSIRRLTPVECARLQGFPDDWNEWQSDTQRYKQYGNAVSVPVIKAIAEKMKGIVYAM